MKKFRFIFPLCILILLTCGCRATPQNEDATPTSLSQTKATEWDRIVQENELKVGVPSLEDSMDNRLIDAFAKEANLTVKKVVLPWDNTLKDAVSNGDVDLLWGQIPATSDSSTMFRLSNPYFHSTMLYLARSADVTAEQSTPVGVLQYSAGQFMAENYFDTVTAYQTKEELLYALRQNLVDCILLDNALFHNMQMKKDFCHIIKEVPYDLVVAFEQNNTSVAAEAEKIIAKIKADGTATDICLQWYLSDYIKK